MMWYYMPVCNTSIQTQEKNEEEKNGNQTTNFRLVDLFTVLTSYTELSTKANSV